MSQAQITDLNNIADEIFRELDEPTDVSVPSIRFWLTSNVGQLNSFLNTDYEITTSFETSGALGQEERDIFKKMYICHYYSKQIRDNLSSAGTDSVVEIASDGARVRKISKNEVAKTYMQLKRSECGSEDGGLIALINAYKLRAARPLQIAGDDTEAGVYPN